MKKEISDLRAAISGILSQTGIRLNQPIENNLPTLAANPMAPVPFNNNSGFNGYNQYNGFQSTGEVNENEGYMHPKDSLEDEHIDVEGEVVENSEVDSLSLIKKEKELILKALTKHKGKRRIAAQDLGISERTLYRKLKEYDIE